MTVPAKSVFDRSKTFDIEYQADIHIFDIRGGVPLDPKLIEGWIASSALDIGSAQQMAEMVQRTMAERTGNDPDAEVDLEAVIKEVTDTKVNGFKRKPDGELYIEGRQVKACIKEAASVSWAAGTLPNKGNPGKNSWGTTYKGLKNFLPEHVFVDESIIGLGENEALRVDMEFIHKWDGTSSIKREEVLEDVDASFTVLTDFDFGDEFWEKLWVRAEQLGIGASRSQERGKFVVTRWDRIR